MHVRCDGTEQNRRAQVAELQYAPDVGGEMTVADREIVDVVAAMKDRELLTGVPDPRLPRDLLQICQVAVRRVDEPGRGSLPPISLDVQLIRTAEKLKVARPKARRPSFEDAIAAMEREQPCVAEHVLVADLEIGDTAATEGAGDDRRNLIDSLDLDGNTTLVVRHTANGGVGKEWLLAQQARRLAHPKVGAEPTGLQRKKASHDRGVGGGVVQPDRARGAAPVGRFAFERRT